MDRDIIHESAKLDVERAFNSARSWCLQFLDIDYNHEAVAEIMSTFASLYMDRISELEHQDMHRETRESWE